MCNAEQALIKSRLSCLASSRGRGTSRLPWHLLLLLVLVLLGC